MRASPSPADGAGIYHHPFHRQHRPQRGCAEPCAGDEERAPGPPQPHTLSHVAFHGGRPFDLPETGEHADYEGPGNRSSIGIEMCVNRTNDIAKTVDRTAQLTARLMRQYHIPLSHVVPHMYWRMIRYSDGRDLGHKQCPRILLDHGQLGKKWNAFLEKVALYARQMKATET